MGLFRRAAIDQVEAPARDRQVIQQDLAQLREQEGEINRRRAALGVQHNQAYAIGDREIIDGLRESQAGLGAELEQVRAQVQHLQQELQAEADNARQEWARRCAHLVDGLAMERMAKLRE